MDNATLINAFVDGLVNHHKRQWANPELRIEAEAGHWQLLAKSEGLVAVSLLAHSQPRVAIRYRSAYWQPLHEAMARIRYLPTGKSQRAGFHEYQQIDIPPGYRVQFTDALDIMQAWWSFKTLDQPVSLISMLVLHRGTWHPVRDLTCAQGTLLIHTLGHVVKLLPLERLAWLQRRNLATQAQPEMQKKQGSLNDAIALPPVHPQPLEPATSNGSSNGSHLVSAKKRVSNGNKAIGHYLMEADLLTPDQVKVALCDQRSTGLRFGEILVQRGWLKQKTIEFLMENVILPQRAAAHRQPMAKPKLASSSINALQTSQPSINARATLITDQRLTDTEIGVSSTTAVSSPELLTIHSRATLITEPLGISTEAKQEQPIDEVLSIHSRETFITDEDVIDISDPTAWTPADIPSVHSRETLITDRETLITDKETM